METLKCTLQNPSLSINTNSFPLKQKIPLVHFHRNYIRSTPNYLHQNTLWKLHAEAKGFGNVSAEKYRFKKRNGRNNNDDNSSSNNNDDNDEKLPREVWERIIGRVLFYVGAPMLSGVILMQVLSLIKEYKIWDVPVWLPFLTTFITFGASTLGVAYGTLSASWDVEEKGTFLGLEQAQKNWDDMWNEEEGKDEEENNWVN